MLIRTLPTRLLLLMAVLLPSGLGIDAWAQQGSDSTRRADALAQGATRYASTEAVRIAAGDVLQRHENEDGPPPIDTARTLAFPGAEGYGKYTRGGRGGRVIAVTNLNDSGPGSLRAAVEAEGPRIVVFRVSGTIGLESALRITNPYITIAGQTAPGDGLAIKRHPLLIDADEVVLRYLRFRLGDETGDDVDALSGRYHKNIIVDHVSASWSVDETVSIYHCDSVTVQWSLISESLYDSAHQKGTHGYGGIWGSDFSTYHHNLLAHHTSRTPRFTSGAGHTDYRNNVVYNWGYNSAYGGEKEQPGNPTFRSTTVNMVANYYKPGPATEPGDVRRRIVSPSSRDGADDFGRWYVAENYMRGDPEVTADNWAGGVQPQGGEMYLDVLKLDAPWEAMPIRQHTAEDAYRLVLQHAGASLPKRDPIDARIVEEVRTGTATFGETYGGGGQGIIDSQEAVGGWPELSSHAAPPDTDGDGMPDAWESGHGLDPHDVADGPEDRDSDGYTNVEEYLNGTDPTVFVDYGKPEHNVNTFHTPSRSIPVRE